MKFYRFTVIFEKEGNNYNVSAPALKGCYSCGESLNEARFNIREAMELYLETILEEGCSIPKDKKIKENKNRIKEEVIVGIDFEVKTGLNPAYV